MALNKREKTLAIAVGCLALGLVAWLALASGPSDSTAELRRTYDKLSKENEKKQDRIDGVQRKAVKRLADWNRRSLPSDPKVAQPLYVQWLMKVVGDVGLQGTKLTPSATNSRAGTFVAIPLSLQTRGSLDQLTQFLYKFYTAGHLHKVRSLTVKPLDDSKDFEFLISVEALSLAAADNRTELTTEPGARLELKDLAAYRQAVVRRRMESERYVEGLGLFTPYAPPPPPPRKPDPVVKVERKPDPPPPKPEPPRFDASKHAYITGIVDEGGAPQVWIHARTQGETLKLRQGERLEIGTVRGTITGIDVGGRSVDIEIGGKHHSLGFGRSLHEAVNGPSNGS